MSSSNMVIIVNVNLVISFMFWLLVVIWLVNKVVGLVI